MEGQQFERVMTIIALFGNSATFKCKQNSSNMNYEIWAQNNK